MKRNIRIALVAVLLFRAVSVTYAWGELGHNIVAEVAKKYLSESVQDSVKKYLGHMSWEAASNWMDDVRGSKNYGYTSSWHYLNLENGQKYDSTIDGGNNIVNQLQIAIRNLMNKKTLTKEDISFNIKVLFHLMGDFHMPLHVGMGSDRGGNDIIVNFLGKQTSLHHIWDSNIIQYKNISFKDIEKLLSTYSTDSIQKITSGTVIEWLSKTRKQLSMVYSYTPVISEDYITKSYPIIESQLLMAGVRLGSILENVFKN